MFGRAECRRLGSLLARNISFRRGIVRGRRSRRRRRGVPGILQVRMLDLGDLGRMCFHAIP